jgi:hypothetical protein
MFYGFFLKNVGRRRVGVKTIEPFTEQGMGKCLLQADRQNFGLYAEPAEDGENRNILYLLVNIRLLKY